MKDINIAQAITLHRKLKGITQDQLANYIGVSKSSVSKWETGLSYPDITFLPQLATFFNISIDVLMGYEPQMSKEDISKLYVKLSKDFSEQDFEVVLTDCHQIIKKYYSCYPLLLQMGALLLNNSQLAPNQKRFSEVVTEAKTLFSKVKTESDDVELVRQATHLEAASLITLGLPKEVIELLEDSHSLVLSSEGLLATAYQMVGQVEKAKETIQIELYQYLTAFLRLLTSYQSLFFNDPEQFKLISQRFLQLSETFNLEELKPDALVMFYLTSAQGNIINGQIEEALNDLKEYARISTENKMLFHLHGDNFFTSIDNWFEQLPLGINPPRDKTVIKQSMYDAIANNPAFTVLKDDIRFINILEKLKNNIKG